MMPGTRRTCKQRRAALAKLPVWSVGFDSVERTDVPGRMGAILVIHFFSDVVTQRKGGRTALQTVVIKVTSVFCFSHARFALCCTLLLR